MKIRSGLFPGMPVVDVYANLNLILFAIVILSLAEMGVKIAENTVRAEAMFAVVVEWNGTSNDDVDTYVQDPMKHLVMFKRLQDGLMNLERDCTGSSNNEITLPDGQKVKSLINQERVDIRGIVPGQYIVNLHMYRKGDSTPTPVRVTLYRMGERFDTIREVTLKLDHQGQEETAFRFTLLKDGRVEDINDLRAELVHQ